MCIITIVFCQEGVWEGEDGCQGWGEEIILILCFLALAGFGRFWFSVLNPVGGVCNPLAGILEYKRPLGLVCLVVGF